MEAWRIAVISIGVIFMLASFVEIPGGLSSILQKIKVPSLPSWVRAIEPDSEDGDAIDPLELIRSLNAALESAGVCADTRRQIVQPVINILLFSGETK